MPSSTRDDRSLERHTGAQSLLKFNTGDGYVEIPITSVDWNRAASTEEIQHNGSMNPTLSTSELRYDGSFEYEGQNPSLLTEISTQAEGGAIQKNRPKRGTLTLKEYNHDDNDVTVTTVTFKRVLITDIDRSLSSDGVSSTSCDFQAEDMLIEDNTA